MEIRNFIAGKYIQQYEYMSFSPSIINIDWEISDIELINLLSKANVKLGELNAFSQLIPDIDFFIKMHIGKESTLSSKIEGTQTNIQDTFQKAENINSEKKDDWFEVQNYISAMNYAISELPNIPISTRLLKQTHFILLQGVRGKNKHPGEFRISQNWIGGNNIKQAVFVPPQHTEINNLMSDLEKFIHNENNMIPLLIKAGIAHYQFETIHPFLDGNGRIGRLLITLILIGNGILNKPCLYISDFFEKNRNYYYDFLSRARTYNDLNSWLKFFLEGVYKTSQNSIDTFKNILDLKYDIERTRIVKLGRKIKLAHAFMMNLFGQPIIDIGDVCNNLKINPSTAGRLVDDFINLGILEEMTGYKRNRIFKFKEYMGLFEN